jgi:hypothetical protein
MNLTGRTWQQTDSSLFTWRIERRPWPVTVSSVTGAGESTH